MSTATVSILLDELNDLIEREQRATDPSEVSIIKEQILNVRKKFDEAVMIVNSRDSLLKG